jgi:hypothetical protein
MPFKININKTNYFPVMFEVLTAVTMKIWRRVVWYMSTNILEECTASIFRTECKQFILRNVGKHLSDYKAEHPKTVILRWFLQAVPSFISTLPTPSLHLFLLASHPVSSGKHWLNVTLLLAAPHVARCPVTAVFATSLRQDALGHLS